jgi:arginase
VGRDIPELLLLNPEWQGHGGGAAVYHDAVALAETLFGPHDLVRVAVPRTEVLEPEDGVLGLGSIASRCRQVLDEIRARGPARILSVAGTCGTEVAPVAYLNERYRGDLAVVWFDAHGDLNTPESSPSGRFHGMVLRTLMGEGPRAIADLVPVPLAPGQVWLAGVRDLDPPESQFVTDAGLAVVGPDAMATPDALVDQLAAGHRRRLYLHVDLDVLDPERFPHSLMQTPGGLAPEALADVIAACLRRFEVVGLSVVEFRRRGEDAAREVADLLVRAGIRVGPESGPRLPL